ncbi:UDP-N-acetylmuramate--L-alanine ligase [Brevibacterium jeotgali]|uniref:UDP-N-acetylmuramate--L-alanine ligase n=1 Tax=Brevibacterium jeotgali TaxID=1262550 RepID=A0A2H1L6M5_9MICO|nr:UDP-N-acetylmuramate--L-alanine ligase [Brevibacterium jeotgali]TWC02654.1 UDP-N-acetylmuramate--L-alanine ligase [Brevibacterium jeotgali]SMY12564.1 UDP-N-acetylmuramate--L-alanine ligase [Brevibacterium jeotgali]
MTTSRDIVPAADLGRVHFIGIGGAGMSGIARVMLARGIAVSGSDARDSDVVTGLRALGAMVTIGHAGDTVEDVDTVVVSSAIRDDNPELVRARGLGLRVVHRSSALGSLMTDRRTVAVAGTHGKTTTTSMTTVALQACAADPSFVIGGVLTATGANAHEGTGDVFVAEADESDGSFLLYEPTVGIVTNVEADHLDHYGTADAVTEAFRAFARRTAEAGGTLVACLDDPGAAGIAAYAADQGCDVIGYGLGPFDEQTVAGLRVAAIAPGGSQGQDQDFTITVGERSIPVALHQPGHYNALNATAAVCSALALGYAPKEAAQGLAGYHGTRRRFEYRGQGSGVRVFDDYAHHPTEITALLTAAKDVVDPGGRVHVVFQPHLFSRTQSFRRDFGIALGIADDVIVLDVFPAREDPVPGVTGAIVADEVPHAGAVFLPAFTQVVPYLLERVQPGDIVLTVGAGDVTVLGAEIVEALGGA